MTIRNKLPILTLLLAAMLAVPAAGQPVTKQLAAGVTFTQAIDTNQQYPLIVNLVTVDPSIPRVEVKAALSKDVIYVDDAVKGREAISSLTARKGALVGTNADYFPFTGDAIGICIIDGELISEPPGNRAALAILPGGNAFFDTPAWDATLTAADGEMRRLDGINRVRETNQIVLYTDTFGASTRNTFKATEIICTTPDLPIKAGKTVNLTVTEIRDDSVDTPIPKGGVIISGGGQAAGFLSDNVRTGDTIVARLTVTSPADRDWSTVQHAVGGGPWLVRDGKQWIDDVAEAFAPSFSTTRHPRTAAGLTADGKLMLVTVDGRQTISGGISLSDLASLMMRLGAVNAINLDGGGSTTMSIGGAVVNSPSEGDERAVADALLVFAPRQICPELPDLAITGLTGDATSGQGMPLKLVCGDDARELTADELSGVVWGTTKGVGFVNQSGYFTPIKARHGTVNATVGSQSVSLDVNVVPGPPAKVTADLTPDKTDPLRATIKVTAFDLNGNRLVGQEVLLSIAGGKSDTESGTTNANGECSVGITWAPDAVDRSVVASVGDVSAEAKPK